MRTFQHIQRENENNSQTRIQPQLEIGGENDEYEKEANHVADKVMRMTDPSAGKRGTMHTGIPAIQKMSTGTSMGMMAPSKMEQGINSSKGGGQNLQPEIQDEMSSKVGADFSNVNIHTDASAIQMNKEIGAKAFTHGNDIYFNEGQYNPASSEGKHLLAHELTHTVQQGSDVRRMIQMKKDNVLPTHFGEWYTEDYSLVNHTLYPAETQPDYYSAQMELHFKANSSVNSEKIGLLQTGHTKAPLKKQPPGVIQDLSGNLYKGENQKKRANSGGAFIDHDPTSQNPLYASTGNPGMGKAAVDKQFGGYGEHYYNATDGKLNQPEKDAWIYDTPFLLEPALDSKMDFETTALSLEGKDAGTYYGSVSWGWKLDSSGKHSLLPLKIVSQGVPSKSFMESAEKWNSSKGGQNYDKKTDQIPLVDVHVLTSDFIIPATKIPLANKVLKKGTRVQIQELPFVYKRALGEVKIIVVDGTYTGLTTMIPIWNLKDESK